MRNSNCAYCGQLLFFENHQCIQCKHRLGYRPEAASVDALELVQGADDGTGLYALKSDAKSGCRYRLCKNTVLYNACNWLVSAADAEEYCESCRLTEVLPNLEDAHSRTAWVRIESAKRRLLYTLKRLKLPIQGRAVDPSFGLTFRFLKGTPEAPVTTGHQNGAITLNIDEADAAFRENAREKLGEAYRTVLGHFRHEIGHYYWELLVASSHWLEPFRKLFGDERADYQRSVNRHYERGPPADWQRRFISAYATMHPWEDFAETWAHYLHMVDTLETASFYELVIRAPGITGAAERIRLANTSSGDFDQLFKSWYSLTFLMNGLSRSMGVPDMYPFTVGDPVRSKLQFVHALCHRGDSEEAAAAVSDEDPTMS